MKKLLLCWLVLSCYVCLFAQEEDINNLQGEELTDSPLLEQLKIERNELAVLEEEVAYYYNLMQQKAAIRELYDKGKISAIEKSLAKQTKLFDKLLEDVNLDEIAVNLGELRIIYGDVPDVQDQIKFYQARLAYLRENLNKARNLLIDLTQNYPDSSRRAPGILLLLEIYHIQGYDAELVALAPEYTGEGSVLQTYWLAHAYFNVDMLVEAQEKFTELSSNEIYTFRAQAMLALITYFQGDLPTAIAEMQTLSTSYESSIKYYDFVILSLARLNIIKEEIGTALQYYEQYFNLQTDDIPDHILFEIASEFKGNNQYDQAVIYLNMIIEKPLKSEYYTSAKFLLAVTQYGYDDLDQSEIAIEEMIAENDELLSTLNRKYKLLTDYHNIRRQLALTDTASHEYINLDSQLDKVDAQLLDTNDMMENFYQGLDPEALVILKTLEEEYISYCSTISDMEALVLASRTMPNERIPAIIENEIINADSTIVSLEVIKYLGHRAYFSPEEYNMARHIAIERSLQEIDLKIWREIQVIAENNNHPEIAEKVTTYVSIVQDNMRAFDIIAELMFGGKPAAPMAEFIQEEIDAVRNNQIELIALKQDVVANFNTQIAKKLNKEKEFLVAEFDLLKLKYDEALNSMISDIASVADKYRINLLDVLFKQTQVMDKNYKELQERVRNE